MFRDEITANLRKTLCVLSAMKTRYIKFSSVNIVLNFVFLKYRKTSENSYDNNTYRIALQHLKHFIFVGCVIQ